MNAAFRLLGFASLALTAVASAQTISTYGDWNGSNYVSSFGNPNTATYGQTFVAPSDSILTNYTSAFSYNGGSAFTYKLYIAPWSDATSRLASAPLFASADLTSVASGAGFQDVAVAPNVRLTGGQKYVAFYSTSAQAVNPTGSMVQALTSANGYANGDFVYSNNGTDLSALSSSNWSTGYTPNDTAFRATFQPVPEPASLAAVGMGALSLLRRRRKASSRRSRLFTVL